MSDINSYILHHTETYLDINFKIFEAFPGQFVINLNNEWVGSNYNYLDSAIYAAKQIIDKNNTKISLSIKNNYFSTKFIINGFSINEIVEECLEQYLDDEDLIEVIALHIQRELENKMRLHSDSCQHKEIVTGAYPRSNPPIKCKICGVFYRDKDMEPI